MKQVKKVFLDDVNKHFCPNLTSDEFIKNNQDLFQHEKIKSSKLHISWRLVTFVSFICCILLASYFAFMSLPDVTHVNRNEYRKTSAEVTVQEIVRKLIIDGENIGLSPSNTFYYTVTQEYIDNIIKDDDGKNIITIADVEYMLLNTDFLYSEPVYEVKTEENLLIYVFCGESTGPTGEIVRKYFYVISVNYNGEPFIINCNGRDIVIDQFNRRGILESLTEKDEQNKKFIISLTVNNHRKLRKYYFAK